MFGQFAKLRWVFLMGVEGDFKPVPIIEDAAVFGFPIVIAAFAEAVWPT
jgi:hypothetical protein